MNPAFIRELDQLLAKHNLARSFSRGNIVISDLAAKEDEGKTSLRHYGRHYGLTEQDHGATFTVQGQRFKLAGVSPSRPKYPLDGIRLGDDKPFKFPAHTAQQIIAARMPPASHASTMGAGSSSGFSPPAGMPQF